MHTKVTDVNGVPIESGQNGQFDSILLPQHFPSNGISRPAYERELYKEIRSSVAKYLVDPIEVKAISRELFNAYAMAAPRCVSDDRGRLILTMPFSETDNYFEIYTVILPAAGKPLQVMRFDGCQSKTIDKFSFEHDAIQKLLIAEPNPGCLKVLVEKGDLKLTLKPALRELYSSACTLDRLNIFYNELSWLVSMCFTNLKFNPKTVKGANPEKSAKLFIRMLAEDLIEVDRKIISLALNKFKKNLDPGISDYFFKNRIFHPGDYNFALAAPTNESKLARAQWAVTFPAFRSLNNTPSWCETIDERREAIPALSLEFKVSTALVKKIRLADTTVMSQLGKLETKEFMNFLSTCDINHVPKFDTVSPYIVMEIGRIMSKSRALAKGQTSFHHAAAASLIANVRGKWSDVAKSLGDVVVKDIADFVTAFARVSILPLFVSIQDDATHCAEHYGPVVIDGEDVGDYEDLVRPCRLEARQESGPISQAKAILLLGLAKNWSLLNFFKASHEWHKTFGRNRAVQDWSNSPETIFSMWPALCEPFITEAGYRIVPLTTSSELSYEGKVMKHCVGSYAYRSKLGISQIASVQDSKGNRLSTIELSVDTGRKHIEVEQHRGPCNSEPLRAAIHAERQFILAVKEGDCLINWDDLRKFEAPSAGRAIIDQIGFNPADQKIWKKAYAEFMDYPSSPLKSNDPLEFAHNIIFSAIENPRLKALEEQVPIILTKLLAAVEKHND